MVMAQHPKKERSFVIVKPDGVQRSLIGEILKRIERTGLKFVAVKFLLPKAYYKMDRLQMQITALSCPAAAQSRYRLLFR
jgi:nucleoside diphosphate kinase